MDGTDNDATSPDHSAALLAAMRQLHAAVEQVEALVAAQLGIGRKDARCLAMLGDGAMAPRSIGTRLRLTSGSVTALIDRLEQRGYAIRRPDPADRRAVLVERTPLGAERLVMANAPMVETVTRLALRYGPERSVAAARQVSDLARLAEWVAAKGKSEAG